MSIDPVCRMAVDFEDAEAETTYNGVTYYFCSEACKETFDLMPEEYLQNKGKKTVM